MKKKKDSSKHVSILLRIILWMVLIFVFVGGARFSYDFGKAIFMDEAMNESGVSDDVELFVLDGVTAKRVGEQLENAGIIEDSNLFYIQALLSGKSNNIKGGTYIFNSSMKPSKILDKLQNGPEE